MSSFKIFIVEDDPWYGEILEYNLSMNPDYEIKRFSNGNDCLKALNQNPNLITVDFSLPDITGDKLLKEIKTRNPNIPVIIISGQEDIQVAVSLLKQGATDYIIKDDNTKDLLWNSVIKVRENFNLKEEVETLKEELGVKYDFDKIIKGNSPAIKKIFSLMEKATKSNITVSITGETGTGKELVAKAIHYKSDRNKKSFVAINMSAIPKELIESELFGHEKGSFTGAIARKIGKFEEANKGTIFLDEIAEMDLNVQSKLLRVLQERELERVGGNEKVKLDVRIIVATHKDLLEEVKKGNFREDLYYRILGLPIALPPLRQRENDIIILAKYFLDEYCKENKIPSCVIENDAKDKLMRHSYPGNIRELKAIIDLAAVMCENNKITAQDINFSTSKNIDITSAEMSLKEYNTQIIQYYLNKYDSNVVKVAEKLDIGKSTIYNLIKEKAIILNN